MTNPVDGMERNRAHVLQALVPSRIAKGGA
jgi:hypothetical protein